jgi:N utilization substance protein B
MGGRRQAREQALQILYQVDLSSASVEDSLRGFWESEPADPDVVEFARILVRGVRNRIEKIDELIGSASINWKISRMSFVDRNILRIAVFEFLEMEDIPAMVSINEAIELGKRFGTSDSGAFINGILDRIARDLELTPPGRRNA